MGYILRHEDYFRTIMEEQLRVESYEQIRIRRKRLESNERRIAELKRLFIKIYEDNASGRLTDECYDMLSQTYEAEQKQLEAEAITLQQEIEVQERQNENIEKFIQKAHKYVGIEELDGYTLRELVSAVYVDAPDKSSGKRVQHIHIRYDGLGFIPLDELMKNLNMQFLMMLAAAVIIGYLVLVIFYGIVASHFYGTKHEKARKRVKQFNHDLTRLNRMYEREKR